KIEPYNFVSALNCVQAQRLVRTICAHCKHEVRASHELLVESGLDPAKVAGFAFRSGRGCGQCRGTGYKGRRAIAEIMVLTDELREMIVAREPIRALKDKARANGTRFLRESALALVREGVTNLQEVNRVTFVA
ncbi:MAG TPA: type II/IV secretion system protein, partial [Burkholderiales bacterium]|nr:type II/IV secretion system protein [Burkholderiales bacterium]